MVKPTTVEPSKDLPEGSHIVKAKDGHSMFVRVWEPKGSARAVVVFFHGLGEHCSRYDHMFTKFAENGIRVKSFDHRGHGRTLLVDPSSSKGHIEIQQLYADYETVIGFNADADAGLPVFLFGHSMGGLFAILFVHDHPELKLAGLIASGPALSPGKPPGPILLSLARFMNKIAPKLALGNGLEVNNISRDEQVVRDYLSDPLVHDKISAHLGLTLIERGKTMMAKDFSHANVPILILHGSKDRLTCPKTTETFFNQLKVDDKTLEIVDEAFHELHNETEPLRTTIYDKYIKWILNHLDTAKPAASQPSGSASASSETPIVATSVVSISNEGQTSQPTESKL